MNTKKDILSNIFMMLFFFKYLQLFFYPSTPATGCQMVWYSRA